MVTSAGIDSLRPWVIFAGCTLIVGALYWAQAILVPIAVSVLLTFALNPLVSTLQRWIGRTVAVLGVVVAVMGALGLASWVVGRQMALLAEDLPAYRLNIQQKIDDVRSMSQGGSVEKVQQTLEDIKQQVSEPDPRRGTVSRPLVVESQQVAGLWGFPTWVGSVLEPIATAMLITVLVIFMLLERMDLRDRIISLIGHGHLATTTRAFDEAATRVSRYLLMQSLVNLLFGVGVAIGLFLIGIPYALLWAALSAALRFIPYVGPWIGAALPIVVSVGAFSGWSQTLWVVGLYAGLELLTNLVLETFLYAGAAGVSQVALLVAVAFWTWLWGPLGLLMATPLTVCVVVLGKHVPGIEFVATLMADAPALTPDVSYYQRLLARDLSEALDILERHAKSNPPDTTFDALMLPALNYAERDRLEGRLSVDEEAAVIEATRELIEDASILAATGGAQEEPAPEDFQLPILGYPANALSDELALQMLGHVLDGTRAALHLAPGRTMVSELVTTVVREGYLVVCIADLPPSPAARSRYLVKKLRSAVPDLRVVVGRWAPSGFADDAPGPLLEAGATHVGTTLVQTRDHLSELARHFRHMERPASHVTPATESR
jgi:predicted PurR-regulated permease PerM